MTVIDLTHLMTEDMPVYPGTEQPRFTAVCTCEKDKFQETLLSFCSHVGTHMDAPAHVFADGATLDTFPAGQFIGRAAVIDCTAVPPGGDITLEQLLRDPRTAEAEFLLLRTGWDRYWGTEAYFRDFPCITEEAAKWLAASGKKGVGLDTISLDPVGKLARHWLLMATGGMVILENLTRLEDVGEDIFTLCALPLKYIGADGAPVRAVALLED